MATLRVPDVVPPPQDDCGKLNKAFNSGFAGLGKDKNAIIEVLGHRSASQRNRIKETYQQLYKKSLIDELSSGLSNFEIFGEKLAEGDFRKAVIFWTYDPAERDARLANEALNSENKSITELQVIVEIACATSPKHLMEVRQAYCSLFDRSLEEDIIKKVSPPVRKVLVGLVSSYRLDREVVDLDVADLEADRLREAIESKHLDRDDIVWILCFRNPFQLKATFGCYRRKYGHHICQDIQSCGDGILESILRVVIWCIDSPEKHFAEVIKAAIVGLGTDENSLTRAIVTRAEVDMMKIKGEYFSMNQSNMDDAVAGDTSGEYWKFLMTLLGSNV
ncbi:hypothetical protein NMG60_11023478 [Bertholletia excelsa]